MALALIDVEVLETTEESILVSDGIFEVWVPRNLIVENHRDSEVMRDAEQDEDGVLVLQDRKARELGLV